MYISYCTLRIKLDVIKKISIYIVLSFSLLLPKKQYILFGTFSTSSFAGEQMLQSAWYYPSKEDINRIDIPKKGFRKCQSNGK